MSKFIKLFDYDDGSDVFFRPEYITAITRNNHNGCYVHTIGTDVALSVRTQASDVAALVEKALAETEAIQAIDSIIRSKSNA